MMAFGLTSLTEQLKTTSSGKALGLLQPTQIGLSTNPTIMVVPKTAFTCGVVVTAVSGMTTFVMTLVRTPSVKKLLRALNQ
jgi:hypothetical protein